MGPVIRRYTYELDLGLVEVVESKIKQELGSDHLTSDLGGPANGEIHVS